MKRIVIGFICMIGLNVLAANYAVTFYSGDPSGIPDGWPQTVREMGEAKGPLRSGESLQTREQLDEIKRSLQPAMDARNENLRSSETSARTNRTKEIQDTLDDLKLALANWDTLTSIQQKAVLRRVVRIILVLVSERSELLEVR